MRRWLVKRRGSLALAVVYALGLLPRAAWACAVCWGGDNALTPGLNVSLLFLMSMPFLIGGSIFSVLYVVQKRARGRRWPYRTGRLLAWTQKEGR